MRLSGLFVGQLPALAVGALCAVALTGCTRENSHHPPVPTRCTSSAECSAEQICTTAGCAPRGCRGNYDCQSGWACYVSGDVSYCAPNDGTSPTPVDDGSGAGTGTGTGTGTGSGTGAGTGTGSGNGGPKSVNCSSTTPCPSGQTCNAGRCYLDGQSACGVLALAQCSANADCGSGKICANGQCASTCNGDCGSGAVCRDGYCQVAPRYECVWNSDCGPASTGARCINGTCLASCTSNAQCNAGDECVRGSCRSK